MHTNMTHNKESEWVSFYERFLSRTDLSKQLQTDYYTLYTNVTHHSNKLERPFSTGKTESEEKSGDQKTRLHTCGRAAEAEYSLLIERSLSG